MKKGLKIALIALAIIALFVGGFFVGRATSTGETKTIVEYVTLDPIHDTITKIVPRNVRVPADTVDIIKKCVNDGIYAELFPSKVITDTMFITSEDSAAIIRDWASERYYTETLFDIDTLGKCVVDFKTQYNRIDSLSYEYVPVQKTVTHIVYEKKLISPFVGAGVDWTVGHEFYKGHLNFDAQAGIFVKEQVGMSVLYRYDFLNNTNSIGGLIMYKF